MAIRVFEIHATASVVAIDFASAMLTGLGPVLKPSLANAAENLVEFAFANQERVVLRGDGIDGIVEVKRGSVAEFDHEEWPEAGRARQAEDFCEEYRRLSLVAAPDDGMV